MVDLLILAGFVVLILGSGVVATNVYCQIAYNRCPACRATNAKRRSRCRKCSAEIE